MVDTPRGTPEHGITDHFLEIRVVLPEVMPEACEPRPLSGAKLVGKALRPVSDAFEMFSQVVPPPSLIWAVRDRRRRQERHGDGG